MSNNKLSIQEIETIIDGTCSKQQLVDIGFNELGLSKSKLSNSSKAIQIVRDALENVKTYYVIEEQARIAGKKRRN